MAHTELVDRRGIHLFKCRAASIHGKSVQILTQQPATTRRWRVSSNAITISLFPESPRHVFSMRKLRILRWMAGGRVPMCPRVSSQGACDWNYAATARSRAGGSTEVRLCGEHRGADTGGVPGYTEVSRPRPGHSEVQLPSLCQLQLHTLHAYSSVPPHHWHCYGSFITSWKLLC